MRIVLTELGSWCTAVYNILQHLPSRPKTGYLNRPGSMESKRFKSKATVLIIFLYYENHYGSHYVEVKGLNKINSQIE